MTLATHSTHRTDFTLAHNADEQVMQRCRLAKELEDAGKYEVARNALGEIWERVGERPKLTGLTQRASAEVLLRAGVLSGYIGSARQIDGAQETAKNLISESITIFEELGDSLKVNEARSDLAVCYWREGAFDEARIVLREVLVQLADMDCEQKASALLRGALVERSSTRFNDALRMLTDASALFRSCDNHSLRGRFHGELALIFKSLSDLEHREDYTDRALVEFTAASYYFEQAGHLRYCARVENNLGNLFITIGRFTEAHEHLNRARGLFVSIKDSGSVAQVDETRARALLAQGRHFEAEKTVKSAVHTLEKGGEHSLLAEALMTYGRVLANQDRQQQARAMFDRAAEVAQQAGDHEGAGQALLCIIEELSETLSPDTMRSIYTRADEMLMRSQHPGVLARLRGCARRILDAHQPRAERSQRQEFIHASARTEAILRDARSISRTEGSILLMGETGTGKEVLARMIHEWSGRPGKFVPVNCAALSETLFESQIFGHRRGSFTDAVEDHIGAAHHAANGTLFLDEVAELSPGNQSKLLRLIEHGEVHPLGTALPERVDVRIIAATNSNLQELVAAGRFREDLFYRLETFHVVLPPLRERPDDIPVIAAHFIEKAFEQHPKQVTFTAEAVEAMRDLPLKGNARELRSLIERTMLTAEEGTLINKEMVEIAARRETQQASLADPWAGFSLKDEVHRFEQRFIELALKNADGKVSRAARLLGFKHHESLNSLLKNRFQNLLDERTPATPRRRSIIRQYVN